VASAALGWGRQLQLDVGHLATVLPLVGAVDEVPERHVLAALGQVEVTGPERLAHSERQREFPHAHVDALLGVAQDAAPGGRDEPGRRIRRQPHQLASGHPASDLERREQRRRSALAVERQRDEPREVSLQMVVARPEFVHLAVIGDRMQLTAGGEGLAQHRIVELHEEVDDGWVRFGRVLLQARERRALLAFGHCQQLLDPRAQVAAEAGLKSKEEILLGLGRRAADDAIDGRAGGQHDLVRTEMLFGSLEELVPAGALPRPSPRVDARAPAALRHRAA